MFIVDHISEEIVHLKFRNLYRITLQVAEELRVELAKHMYNGHRSIIIDLENIHYIDCKGFETLLAISKLAEERRMNITLCNVSDETFELIDLMQLAGAFTISSHPAEIVGSSVN
jgi:anti-anti-sigma factor